MAAETAGRPRLIEGGGQGGLGTPILGLRVSSDNGRGGVVEKVCCQTALSLGPQTHLVIQSHIA